MLFLATSMIVSPSYFHTHFHRNNYLVINDSRVIVHIIENKDQISINNQMSYASFQHTFIHRGDTFDLYINCANITALECRKFCGDMRYAINVVWQMKKQVNCIWTNETESRFQRNEIYFDVRALEPPIVGLASAYYMYVDANVTFCHCNLTILEASSGARCQLETVPECLNVLEVIVHEFGHVFGLGHASSSDSVMFNFTKGDVTMHVYDYAVMNYMKLKDSEFSVITSDEIPFLLVSDSSNVADTEWLADW